MVEDMVGQEGVSDPAKWQRQPVQIAAQRPKFPSSQPKADLFTAGNASKNAEDQEGAHKFV